MKEILAGYSNLGCRLFSFITLSMSCHSLLAWRVSIEISAVILMGMPLCVICCFSLAAFNICSLCLIFVNLINMCLGVFLLELILFGTLCISWTWVIISFPVLGKLSTLISSSIFSWSFFFVFFFWNSYKSNVWVFHIVLEVSEIVLISFNSFFFLPLWFIYFYYSIFYLTPLFYYLLPPECFWSHLLHYSLLLTLFYFS